MEKPSSSAGLKIAVLVGGHFIAGVVAAFVSIGVAVMVSTGHGAGATGDRMMLVLGILGLLLLASPPLVFLIVKRWAGRAGLALALAFFVAMGNGLIWFGTALMMAVVLNR